MMVAIEDFASLSAILDEAQIYLGGGGYETKMTARTGEHSNLTM